MIKVLQCSAVPISLLFLNLLYFCYCNVPNAFDDTILFKINWPGNSGFGIIDPENKADSMLVNTHQNEKYYCILPKIKEKEKSFEEEYNGPNPLELLTPLFQASACSSRLESYWTYEICHGKYVKQYHEEREGKKISLQEYYLGRWDKFMSATLNDELDKGKQIGKVYIPPVKKLDGMSLPYLQLNFTDGTVCDLNGKPRQTNVLYICYAHGKNDIYSIKEISTCVYEVIILTPFLCQHPKYRPQESGEHDINCLPVQGQKKPRSLVEMETESLKQRHFKSFNDMKIEKLFSVYSIEEYKDKQGRSQVRVELLPLDDGGDFDNENSESTVDSGRLGLEPDSAPVTTAPAPASLGNSPPIPLPLQEFLSGKDCLRGGSGWWKYKFCYGDSVEQYHIEKGPDGTVQKTEILLGIFKKEDHIEWLRKNPHKRPKPLEMRKHFSHFYSSGSFCEKTGKPRETEVKLKCVEKKGTVSLYLLEPHVCQYELGVESPLVCDLLDKIDEFGLLVEQEKP